MYYSGVIEVGTVLYLNYDLTTLLAANTYYTNDPGLGELIITVNSSGAIISIV